MSASDDTSRPTTIILGRAEHAKCDCGKRIFRSSKAARAAHSHLRFRVKVYRCDLHPEWLHVASLEKRGALPGRY